MKRNRKWVIRGAVAVVTGAAMIAAFAKIHSNDADKRDEQQKAQTTQSQARVSEQGGKIIVKLDASEQTRNGIKVDTLHFITHKPQIRASAIVLSTQELTDFRKSYVPAVTDVEKAKLSLNVSRQEYERIRALYQLDQNVSAKTMQAAEAAWRTDEVTLRAAQNVMKLTASGVRQSWGSVIEKWIVEGSPALDRILAQSDLLVQVSLSLPATSNAPATATIQLLNGELQSAKLVSAFPRVDPRIQSQTFVYVTRARIDLAPGMSLVVLLPSGPAVRGAVIPGNAIVWWQGKMWAYVQSAPGEFSRREVPTQIRSGDGWFVIGDFAGEDKVVVRGAQQLLSEEVQPPAQALGDEDKD